MEGGSILPFTIRLKLYERRRRGIAILITILIAFIILSVITSVVVSMNWGTLKIEGRQNENFPVFQREVLARSLVNAIAESVFAGKININIGDGIVTSNTVKLEDGNIKLYAKLAVQKYSTAYVIRAQVSKTANFVLEETTAVTARIPLPITEEKILIWNTLN